MLPLMLKSLTNRQLSNRRTELESNGRTSKTVKIKELIIIFKGTNIYRYKRNIF